MASADLQGAVAKWSLQVKKHLIPGFASLAGHLQAQQYVLNIWES